jgi:hypothetical protein
MRLIALSLSVLMAASGALLPTQAQALGEAERAELCQKLPDDAQCQPIAFADRPGEPGACVITVNQVPQQTVCKLVVNNGQIMAYQEIGAGLESLKGQKASREILLSSGAIKAIRYQEGQKGNGTARVINTLVFGWMGLLTRDKKVAEISMDYAPPLAAAPVELPPNAASVDLPSGALAAPAVNGEPPAAMAAPQPSLMTLSVVVRRKTGEELRRQLEELTGLKAEGPQSAKQPELKPDNEPAE